MKTLVVCSGGLDSVTLAYKIAKESPIDSLVSFDYGQRHTTEIEYAKYCAEKLTVPHDIVDIRSIGRLLGGSALTDDVDVPDGHYEEESMRVTVVPNRNAIMLSIVFGVAAARACDAVAIAVHGGDHFIYPDCRPDFIESFQKMQNRALDGVHSVQLLAPFVNVDKAEIVRQGAELGVPFIDTWSCYQGNELHCGRCGTCVERREAFSIAGLEDPTQYLDPDFWKQAVSKHAKKEG
ncbi:MAG: 7-cyano-7-deazaguanine synthase QueC [Gammaproteobacteria bacterium]|nr:7-cyano-7-deazaguanine synthase QueC [Gammaproteobacteria bacterium]